MSKTTPEMKPRSRARESSMFDQASTSSLILAFVRDGTAYRPDSALRAQQHNTFHVHVPTQGGQ